MAMWMSSSDSVHAKRPVSTSPAIAVQTCQDLVALLGGQHADGGQHAHVRLRPLDVERRQHVVERDGRVQPLEQRGLLGLEPAAPGLLASPPLTGRSLTRLPVVLARPDLQRQAPQLDEALRPTRG